MSKLITKNDILHAFPNGLRGSEEIAMIASVVAEELQTLNEESNLAAIYTQIDELDGDLLDILAYDFKIDWWDANADDDTKKSVFKNCFNIHRRLGTTGAVSDALTDMYSTAQLQEWTSYNGLPFHYKITVDLGEEFYNEAMLNKILTRAKFYKNVRSYMDSIKFSSERTRNIYVGCALLTGITVTYTVAGIDYASMTCLTDESNELLMDDEDNVLIE